MVNEAMQRAAQKAGGAAALAALTHVSRAAVYQWINGERPVPASRAPVIEQATGERCEDLCPSVPWALIRKCDCGSDCTPAPYTGPERRK